MRFPVFVQSFLLAAAICISNGGAMAQTTAPDKAVIKKMVGEVLEENPEILLEALANLRKKLDSEKPAGSHETLSRLRQELEHDPGTFIAGNAQGDITIVEFFDYRCGFCKRSHPIMKELLAKDPGIRLALREFPILGPESLIASRAAIAAMAQHKYAPFHDALMTAQGPLSAERVMALAGDSGLDVARLHKDMDNPAIDKTINRNHEIAQALAISGTPSFIIGDTLAPGFVDLEELQHLVAAARNKCETCN